MDENPYQPPEELGEHAPVMLPHGIQLQGSIPIRDVLHTQLLILSHRWIYALGCLGLYVALVLALGMLSTPNSLFASTFFVLGLIVMPAILPLTLLMVCLRVWRDARRRIGVFAVTETEISESGIASSVTDTGMPWSAFKAYTHSQRVALLFLKASNNHLIISRAKFVDPDDWHVLLSFLHDRLPRW